MSKPVSGAEWMSKAQREVLERMAKPCEVNSWKYPPYLHPYWNTATYRSLINRGLIERDDLQTLTKEGWTFTAHLCKITAAGRAALEEK